MVGSGQEKGPEPASETKEVLELVYSLPRLDTTLYLKQDTTLGTTTGTTLWLSAQILACYLQAQHGSERGKRAAAAAAAAASDKKPKVVELGAGTGLISLLLARMGWQVVSTDVEPVLSHVLRPNVARNARLKEGDGIEVKRLDWREFDESHAQEMKGLKMVVTADTVYEPSLVDGLWRTIRVLLQASPSVHALIALERRDSAQIDSALDLARRSYGLTVQQINPRQIRKAVDGYLGSAWPRESWCEVEIWRACL